LAHGDNVGIKSASEYRPRDPQKSKPGSINPKKEKTEKPQRTHGGSKTGVWRSRQKGGRPEGEMRHKTRGG